ncbi:hypothetical protein REPUB_Repub16aG0019500 [Reevesia pubescens]
MKQASLIFAASLWSYSHVLLLKCDNVNVVGWIKDPKLSPWRSRKHINMIKSLNGKISYWQISKIPKM